MGKARVGLESRSNLCVQSEDREAGGQQCISRMRSENRILFINRGLPTPSIFSIQVSDVARKSSSPLFLENRGPRPFSFCFSYLNFLILDPTSHSPPNQESRYLCCFSHLHFPNWDPTPHRPRVLQQNRGLFLQDLHPPLVQVS